MDGETGPVNLKHVLFMVPVRIYLRLLLSPTDMQAIKFGKAPKLEGEGKKIKGFKLICSLF